MTSIERRILLPEDNQPVASLKDYCRRGGMTGWERAKRIGPEQTIEELRRAGLRGRGGAGFPTAIKWTTIYRDPAPKKFVVCNCSEGEPGTYKDRFLIDKNPYPLLEGLLIAGMTVSAPQVFIGIKAKFKRQRARLERAVEELTEAGYLRDPSYVQIVPGPDAYLFGEEKALLEVIDGRDAMPRILPPFIQGIRCSPGEYNPTIVNNVETLSHAAMILRNGADWFRSIGSEDTPGTMIFTLCGDVARPGMYELPLGTTLRQLIDVCGEGPAGHHDIQAVFSGVANPVMTPDLFDTPMGFGTLRAAGGGLGSAGMIVYDKSMCMVRAAQMFSTFLAQESCGQCVPCKMGCGTITRYLMAIEGGRGKEDDLEAIAWELNKVTNQTRCFLPAEEQILVRSLLKTFRSLFQAHLDHSCPSDREPELPLIDDFDEDTHTFTYAAPKEDAFMLV